MKKERNFLIMLFIAALTIRLLFSFYLQQFYFGHFEFKYADGPQYLNPVINLINNGEYRGDAFLDDSRYFRPPVYPFFLGIIYLVFSAANLDYVVAGIQCLLGAFSVILVYYIVCNISERKKTALISGIIIALYPFAILWTPLMYTETVQLFLILSMIYLASNKKISIKSTIMQGALVGLILLTKQYMALVIIIPLYIILFTATLTFKKKVIHLCTLMFSFILVLSPWVLRNYMSSGKVIVFFGKTSGLRYALDDAVAFGQFANKFDENTTEYIKSVVETGSVKFVKHPVFLAAHRKDIDAATKLAYQCGGSFLEARQHTLPGQPPYRNCNQEVVRKFDRLSQQFWQEVPFWESMETRIDAL